MANSVINIPKLKVVELPFFKNEIKLETGCKIRVEVVKDYLCFGYLCPAFLVSIVLE